MFVLVTLFHLSFIFFFLIDRAPPEIYPFPLPAALPISPGANPRPARPPLAPRLQYRRSAASPCSSRDPRGAAKPASALAGLALPGVPKRTANTAGHRVDRKSTRLNSSHLVISYAVFCLK